MRIHALINHPIALPGLIMEWIEQRGHTFSSTQVYEGQSFPDVESFDMLLILGGTMGAYEEDKYPWLRREKEFILGSIEKEKYVLGICLGAQLIADVLGGKVFPHKYEEIGWTDIQLTGEGKQLFNKLPDPFTIFQYHGDTFTLPKGAVLLAENNCCRNQAFRYGEGVIGLQFHPEFDSSIIQEIVIQYGEDINDAEGPYIQHPSTFLKHELIDEARKVLFCILDYFE